MQYFERKYDTMLYGSVYERRIQCYGKQGDAAMHLFFDHISDTRYEPPQDLADRGSSH